MCKKTIILLFLITCQWFRAQIPDKEELNIAWKFRQKGKAQWMEKNVSGNVHLDLFANGQIPEPYYSDNEKKLKWIENEDWEYDGEFHVSDADIRQAHAEICFDGLDTYATVYLNDSLIITADNMFRQWKAEVKKFLRPGKNALRIVFESAVRHGKSEAAKLSYTLPEGERVYSRKAQYQYGWDWGPRFVSAGLSGPVSLHCWSKLRIKSSNFLLQQLDSQKAVYKVAYEIESDLSGEAYLRCAASISKKLKERDNFETYKRVVLKPGLIPDTLNLTINHPQYWWCNGLGDQRLYSITSFLQYQGDFIGTRKDRLGIRKLKLISEQDKDGAAFYFKLNEKPVFIKGANYIPASSFFLPAIGEHPPMGPALANKAGMNMLRVWGGGTYQSDKFYEECDRLGILVWQDLIFACAMYPGDEHFVQNVKEEVKDQVIRLRNHPSLALWCGNNENYEGWKNWGWQKQFNYSKTDSAKIWNDYLKLFHKEIPEVLKRYDSQTAYWPSSPSIGWGHNESLLSGDSHYWGVWWGMEPFSAYQKKVGRFVSEYGFQSLPDYRTFQAFCPDSELYLGSASVKAHQKHKTGFETINEYMKRDYKIPNGFREYIYTSQLLQRDGMKMAIEAHRTAKPYCMGTMFWQFNDCWPVTSWSAVDSEQRPKAFYYALKQLYADYMVTVAASEKKILVTCITDKYESESCKLSLQLMDFNGKIIWEKKEPLTVSNTNNQKITMPLNQLPQFDSTKCLMLATLFVGNKQVASNHFTFTPPKNLALPPVALSIRQVKGGLEVSSDVFAKDVFIYSENKDINLQDNFFDLLPGEKKTIKLPFAASAGTDEIKYIVLNNLK